MCFLKRFHWISCWTFLSFWCIGFRRPLKPDHEEEAMSDPPPLDRRESKSDIQAPRMKTKMSFRTASQATITFLSARRKIEGGLKSLGKRMSKRGSVDGGWTILSDFVLTFQNRFFFGITKLVIIIVLTVWMKSGTHLSVRFEAIFACHTLSFDYVKCWFAICLCFWRMEAKRDHPGGGCRKWRHYCEGEEVGGQVPDQVGHAQVLLPAGVCPSRSYSWPPACSSHAGTGRLWAC